MNLNYIKLSAVCTCVLLLTGCASDQSTSLSFGECKYPDSPNVTAPGWVCDQPVDALEVQAVGYSKKLASGIGMMKSVAAAEGRSTLVNAFSSDINNRLSRLTTEVTSEDSTISSDTIERVQNTLATMTIANSRIYQSKISPNGNMYVLVGLDKTSYDKNIDTLVNTAINDESPLLYRKFLKDEGNKTLDQIRKELAAE